MDDYFIDKTGKPLSREAMLRFFRDHCRDIYLPGKPVNPPAEDWAKADIEWAVQNGILFGDGNGNYQLDRACTRREMVAFLHRLYKLVKN